MISSRQNRTHSTERFSFVHCEKHSDVFRTRQKKERELQQLVQNTILPIKCSSCLLLVLGFNSAWHQEPGHGSPLSVSNLASISSRIVFPPMVESGWLLC